MARICEVVFVSAALFVWAASAADIVQQCPGRPIEGLSENVKLSPCKRSPCKLKKGTNQHISIKFTPGRPIEGLSENVKLSPCKRSPCKLKKGTNQHISIKFTPGRPIEGLSENVKLSPCKRSPCKLKKGTNQHISIKFTPDSDLKEVKNHVTAEVFGVPLPFVGVDGVSVCGKIFNEDGSTASCPLRAGSTYTYKDSFPVLAFYPTLQAKVHWALMDGDKEFVCFEIPVNIA